jgi:parallel beta-helix repeat protein
VTGLVNETFYKSDLIYGPQTWKPANTVNYPFYKGQSSSDSFTFMFIDLYAAGFTTSAYGSTPLIDSGSIRVDYSFNNLESAMAVFGAYGWFSACNWGTGTPQYSNILQGGYNVQGVPKPVASFSTDKTSGLSPLTLQFTDTSTNNPTSWAWDFDNDGTTDSTLQNPSWTYNTPGTYTVALTAANAGGSRTITQSDLINVWGVVNSRTNTIYTTIQSAINDSRNGDVLKVYGEYTENVVVGKTLTLNAVGTAKVTPLDASSPVFTVTKGGRGSTINGFTISGGSSGISLISTQHCTLINNQLVDNQYGIILDKSQQNTIKDNTIQDNDYGIALKNHSNNNNIENNRISGNDYGIYLDRSNNNTLTANTLQENKVGIGLYNKSNSNTATSNTLDGNQYGVYVDNSNDNSIYTNEFLSNTVQVYDDGKNNY